jgi:SNF2 family DNA or RNA helicase
MVQMVYGLPEGFKEKVLAVLTDSSTELRARLGVLGFKFNPLGQFWSRKDFQPHVVSTLRSFGVEPSEAVLEEYKEQTCFRPMRVFEDNFKYEMLLPYQNETLEFCKTARSGIVALDIGLGKTPCAAAYAEFLGQKTLIVCPASLKSQWYSELSKFNNIDPSRIIIEGTKAKREKQWRIAQDFQYVILSYDLLKQKEKKTGTKVDLDNAKEFLSGGLLICDEATRAKNKTSQRTKALFELRESASNCLALSGTPLENSLAEFWTILNLVSPKFFPSYERFADMFLVQEIKQRQVWDKKKNGYVTKEYPILLGEKNVDTFKDLIKPLVFRREKRECINLPPASTVIRSVFLSKEQKRIEKRLLELAKEDSDNVLKYFTYARESIISPDLLPVKIINTPGGLSMWNQLIGEADGLEYIPSRVQELVEGKIRPEDIELTPRLQEVADIIEESGKEKIIIYSPYVKALELVRRCILKEPCAMLIGGCNELEDFKKDKRVLLMSSAGEEGHNIQVASLMIIIDRPYNPAKLAQLKGRIERKGQKHPMTFYELNSSSVIESRINKILERKEKLSEKVLARKVMNIQ